MGKLSELLVFVRNSGGILSVAKAAFVVWKTNGTRQLLQLVRVVARRSFGGSDTPGGDFARWISKYGSYVSEKTSRPEKGQPYLFSIILPVFNPEPREVELAIESILRQTYTNWELCIVDDHSDDEDISNILESFAIRDSRIKLRIREKNGHISLASNDAIAMATGDYLTFLDHDDEMVPWALDSLVRSIDSNPKAKMFYSDEAIVDIRSRVVSGHIKGGLNRTLAWSYNYFCHLTAYSKSLMDQIGNFRIGMEGAQDYDLALRALEVLNDSEVIHIPEVLYYWRSGKNSTSKSIEKKPYALKAGMQAVADHLERTGVRGKVQRAELFTTAFRVHLEVLEEENSVSVIIPTRDNLEKLSTCIDSILKNTKYTNYEIIVVDNGSQNQATLSYLSMLKNLPQLRIVRIDHPFNYSNLNNEAAKIATGRHLLLLNDDTQVINQEWMMELVSFSQLPFVGAVGAKLLYPDLRVQHAGVILGIGSVAGHAHRLLDRNDPGYAGRAVLHQDFMAVTGACLMVEKDAFWKVGGLDEQLAVSFNDVDFCLRLHQLGLRNVFTPHAQLIHHESVSRGADSSPENIARALTEIDFMIKRWGELLQNDPYYSINFSNQSNVYSFAKPPRI
jgi:glycosyltransferase involved in cell wall biosynthesis